MKEKKCTEIENAGKPVPLQQRVSLTLCDKDGMVIKVDDKILIENKRKDISREGIVYLLNGDNRLRIKYPDGKDDSVHTWLDAIWWRNDIPENFIKILAN